MTIMLPILVVVWLVRELLRAPVGWQDARGFHLGGSLALLFCVVLTSARAADVNFGWDAVPGADKYTLTLSNGQTVTATDNKVTVALGAGTYTATVCTVIGDRMSDPSDPLTFRVTVLTLQTSSDLLNWTTTGTTVSDVSSDPQRFYRLTLQ